MEVEVRLGRDGVCEEGVAGELEEGPTRLHCELLPRSCAEVLPSSSTASDVLKVQMLTWRI